MESLASTYRSRDRFQPKPLRVLREQELERIALAVPNSRGADILTSAPFSSRCRLDRFDGYSFNAVVGAVFVGRAPNYVAITPNGSYAHATAAGASAVTQNRPMMVTSKPANG